MKKKFRYLIAFAQLASIGAFGFTYDIKVEGTKEKIKLNLVTKETNSSASSLRIKTITLSARPQKWTDVDREPGGKIEIELEVDASAGNLAVTGPHRGCVNLLVAEYKAAFLPSILPYGMYYLFLDGAAYGKLVINDHQVELKR